MTTAAVPSTDPVDFLLNVETLDAAINSTNPTLVDRLGTTRSTLNGAIDSLKAFNVRGPWVTATPYAIKDVYTFFDGVNTVAYVTLIEHTSTTVAADLAAGYVTVHQGMTREDLAAPSGASLVGFIQAVTGAIDRTVQDKLSETVSVFDFMTAAQIADVQSGAASIDVIGPINLACAGANNVYFPPGSYLITRPINLTARRAGDFTLGNGRRIYGAGSKATHIVARTSGYPIVDMTGSCNVCLEHMWLQSDVGANLANVGIINRRGSSSAYTSYCHYNTYNDIVINLRSDSTANGGSGTIGFMNFGGEHIGGKMAVIYANLPMYIGNILDITGMLTSNNIATYGTEYEVPGTSSVSCTNILFEIYVLVAYDTFRSLYIAQVGNMTFQTCYSSNRGIGGTFLSATQESFYIPYGGEEIHLDFYQEESGVEGGVYRCDHAYLNIGGSMWNSTFLIARGLGPIGRSLPATAVSSILIGANTSLFNCDFKCNFLQFTYVASSQLPGLATAPFTFTGGGTQTARNCTFLLDSVGHESTDLSLWPQGTVNCLYVNYFNGTKGMDTYSAGAWTPSDASGAGVTFSGVQATYVKNHNAVTISLAINIPANGLSAAVLIGGLPFAPEAGSYVSATQDNSGRNTVGLVSNAGGGRLDIYDKGSNYVNCQWLQFSGKTLYATATYFI